MIHNPKNCIRTHCPECMEWARTNAIAVTYAPLTVSQLSAENDTMRQRLAELEKVYKHARGLCFGEDWNKGTHAMYHRIPLLHAVNAIEPLPAFQRPPAPGEGG